MIAPTLPTLTMGEAADTAALPTVLADLAAVLDSCQLGPDDLVMLTMAADDLLTVAIGLAPDPGPYLVARAAVGSLPMGADIHRPAPASAAEHGQPERGAVAA